MVVDNVIIIVIIDSVIFGDNSVNWWLIVYGLVFDNFNYFVVVGVVYFDVKMVVGF